MSTGTIATRTLLVAASVEDGGSLLKALSEAGFNVTWARQLCQSLSFAAESQLFDCLVLDVGGFPISEVALVEKFRRQVGNLPLIALSNCDEIGERLCLMDAGADESLLKSAQTSELVVRIRTLMRRTRQLEPDGVCRVGRLALCPLERRAELDGQATKLTGREFALLHELVVAKGRVVPRETLLNRVWGSERPADTVVEYVVHMIRKKVGRDTIRTVSGVGYAITQLVAVPQQSFELPLSA